MSYEVETIDNFKKEVKKLSKKYPSLKEDLLQLGDILSTNPFIGNHLGKQVYKVRLAIKSKRTGKSRGGRVITHILIEEKIVYLLSIYDKSVQVNITDEEIERLLALVKEA